MICSFDNFSLVPLIVLVIRVVALMKHPPSLTNRIIIRSMTPVLTSKYRRECRLYAVLGYLYLITHKRL